MQAVDAATDRVALSAPAPDSLGIAKEGWWISDTVAQGRNDQPVFYGVRLANAPQAALVETYKQLLTAGETLAIRLWGCNDLPAEFTGRAQVVLKRGNDQLEIREETVNLAPETAKRLAKYSIDTKELAGGQYTLVASLFDKAGVLVQRQETIVTVQVSPAQEARRQAKAAEQAKKDAELKAKTEQRAKAEADKKAAAELSRQNALAAATAKSQAKAGEKAKKDADLKAKTEQKAKVEQIAKAEAPKQAASDLSGKNDVSKPGSATKSAGQVEVASVVTVKPVTETQSAKADMASGAKSANLKQGSNAPVAKDKSTVDATTDQSSPSALATAASGKPVAVTQNDTEKNKWRIAMGMLYRKIGAQRFKTGSYSAGYAIPNKSSRDHWDGSAGGFSPEGNRTYDDGYVKSDNYTDLDGGTWNWGYNSGRQVNGNQVELSWVNRVWRDFNRQTVASEAEYSDNADYSGGLMVEAERFLVQTRFVDYGLSLGLSRAQTFRTSANGINNFNDNQSWATYNDRIMDAYDITGLGITPNSVPYRGNIAGPGPVMDATEMSRRQLGSELVSAGTYEAYNSISESLDMDLSTLSLGVSIKGNYRRLYLMGSTGPTLNMVETDATYDETLYESNNGQSPRVLQYWTDNSSGTECMIGYYVQAEVGVRIYRELHLGVFGRYDWLENVSGNVGPSRYEVNPSGGSMGGSLGLNF